MLEVYCAPAFGTQFSSLKSTRPGYSIPHATREQREKLHLSHEHDRTSPKYHSPGPIYNVDERRDHMQTFSFGTGPQRYVACSQAVESSNDLLRSYIDDQNLKFKKAPSMVFGTDSRDNIRNATILQNHPQAFYGTHSPGPASYSLPDIIGKESVMKSMGHKTKILVADSQTSETIGPGSYVIPSTCGGSQSLSRVPNQPVFTFPKDSRPDPSGVRRRSYSQPVAKDSFVVHSIGPQYDSTKRSAPRPIMGSQTREQWSRVGFVVASADVRVSNNSVRLPLPQIPPRREIIRWGS